MKWTLWMCVLVMMSVVTGCWATTSQNTVMDGDRALSWQNAEAAKRLQADKDVPDKAKSIALDVQKNSETQLKNWGPPKDPATFQPYSPEQSEKDRQRSDKEHKEKQGMLGTVTLVGGAVLALITGMLMRGGNIGAIPVIGPLINAMSPRLANGAAVNEKIAVGAMTVLDKVRDILDRKQPLDGDAVKEMIRGVMGDAGVLPQNTALYNSIDTGVPEESPKS